MPTAVRRSPETMIRRPAACLPGRPSGWRPGANGTASFGCAEYGTPYHCPGWAIVVLGRGDVGEDWVAQHIHASVFRDASKRAATRKKREALRLPFRVLRDTFGPGRAFVQSRVQSMLVGMEADAWPYLL